MSTDLTQREGIVGSAGEYKPSPGGLATRGRVERRQAHDKVLVWDAHGAAVGMLTVLAGEGDAFARLLTDIRIGDDLP